MKPTSKRPELHPPPAVLPYRPRASLRQRIGGRHGRWRRLEAVLPGQPRAQGPLARDHALAALEAVLLAADEPLPPRRLATAAGLQGAGEARRLVRRLHALYEKDGSAFQVEELAGGFQLFTRAEFFPWLARFRQGSAEVRLSQAARETLAIIAYRQPIMRADVEAIRGVQCGDVLRLLMERGLVRIAGRHPSLGRPVLYGTTRQFLQLFGLKSLEELPNVEQLRLPPAAAGGRKQGLDPPLAGQPPSA